MVNLYVKVKDEWRLLDKTSDIDFPLNKSFENLTVPTQYINDYSKTIELPISPNNNEIFSAIYRLDSVITTSNFDPTKKVDFMLLHDRSLLIEGYLKMNSIQNYVGKQCYNITLYGKLGDTISTLRSLTFNENSDNPDLIIENPLSDGLKMNRFLIQQSWENDEPQLQLEGATDTDIVGFCPTQHGFNNDFNSDQIVTTGGNGHQKIHQISELIDRMTLHAGSEMVIGDGLTERQMGEYRSYYEKPYVYINKLWQIFQRESERRCDYKLNLNGSWFTEDNPYYSKLVYMLPDFGTNTWINVNAKDFNPGPAEFLRELPANGRPAGISTPYDVQLDFPQCTDPSYNHITREFDVNTGVVGVKYTIQWKLHAALRGLWGVSNQVRMSKHNSLVVDYKLVDTNGHVINKITKIYKDESCDVSPNFEVDEFVIVPHATISNYLATFSWDDTIIFEGAPTDGSVSFHIEAHFYSSNNPFQHNNLGVWTSFYYENHDQFSKNNIIGIISPSIISYADTIRSGAAVTMGRLFPSEKSPFDVLLDYCKMFGLLMIVNKERRTIDVTSIHEFFSKHTFIDWTEKIDRSKELNITPLSFESKYVEFGYEDVDEDFLNNYKEKYQISYGGKRITTDWDFDTATSNMLEGVNPSTETSLTMFSFFNLFRYDGGETPIPQYQQTEIFPSNISGDESANLWGNFYFRGHNQRVDDRLSPNGVVITDDSIVEIDHNQFCYNLNGINMTSFPKVTTIYDIPYWYDDYTDFHYSCQFEKSYESYISPVWMNHNSYKAFSINYIYNLCWRSWVNERYNIQNKKLTAYFNITPSDFYNFNFNKFVKIDDNIYMVNKIIEFNPNTPNTTKCELVQISDVEAYESSIWYHYLNVDRRRVDVTAGTSNPEFVRIDSDSRWTTTADRPWINVVPAEDGIYISPNVGSLDPSIRGVLLGYVDVTSGDITKRISVTYRSLVQSITPNSLTFPGAGGSNTVRIVANEYPEVILSSVPSWVVVGTPVRIPGNSNYIYECSISVSPNRGEARSATISFATYQGGPNLYLTINQLAGRTVITGGITIGDSDHTTIITPFEITSVNPISETIEDGEGGTETITITPEINRDITSGGKCTLKLTPQQISDFSRISGGIITMNTADGQTISVPVIAPEPK